MKRSIFNSGSGHNKSKILVASPAINQVAIYSHLFRTIIISVYILRCDVMGTF